MKPLHRKNMIIVLIILSLAVSPFPFQTSILLSMTHTPRKHYVRTQRDLTRDWTSRLMLRKVILNQNSAKRGMNIHSDWRNSETIWMQKIQDAENNFRAQLELDAERVVQNKLKESLIQASSD